MATKVELLVDGAPVWELNCSTPHAEEVWADALGEPITELDGQAAADVADEIDSAITAMSTQQEQLVTELWTRDGTQYNSVHLFLTTLADAIAARPTATVRVESS